ncbi:lipocalin family protein [Maribacter sp. PR1]|uniref:Lipocalin family protein n=1 Tax=Maribacter cobaltidurans TaxID=1178778 RepID=A0ABU7IP60_9FLAO|nr:MULTISPECIES: lipocalin family protein [Maribacter]MDC6387367.1 lipocalin family protein [Maribacter sp. PR1]MEE1974752.1 lipocalin family protein [Maribacter cobaltidurans]
MKKSVFSFLIMFSLLISCSSDKGDEPNIDSSVNIVGTWDATELQIDESTANDDALFAREILAHLTDKDCYIITLQFNADMTASAINSANFIEINATQTGLDIPCPTQSDTETSTYSYEGNVVSFVDANGDTVAVDVTINGDVMTVNAADLQIPEFNESGQLIFQRR